jgi:phospholipase C
VPLGDLSRRDFLSLSARTAGAVLLSSCTPDAMKRAGRRVRPRAGVRPEDIDTQWPIKRVVYVILENRSFDNVFGRFPGAEGTTVGLSFGIEKPLERCPDWLPGDLPHDQAAHIKNVNRGTMDNFGLGAFGYKYGYSQFIEADIPNYYHWARQNVLCDNFFASQSGPSYANHLYSVAGTAGGVIDNPENIRVLRTESGQQFKSWGCDAYGDDVYVLVRDHNGQLTKHDTCFSDPTVGEQLTERDVDWASYSASPDQPGYIWQAYSAYENVYGTELWDRHIEPVDRILDDIEANALPSVTWVTPRFQLSDHPPYSTGHAHNWVTDLVNGIMESDAWDSVAIFVTWDEWGGFYDHVLPPKVDHLDLGIRVPMVVISPYAKKGYIDHELGEFTSPLGFVADNWGLPYLTERYDKVSNLEQAFDFRKGPRPPDPRPKLEGLTEDPWDFPEDFPEWPDYIQPMPPKIAS